MSQSYLAKKLDVGKTVVFTGGVSEGNLTALYDVSDSYLHAAVQEHFGFGLIKAVGCDTQAITWNDGGPSETIVNGETGYIVTLYDEEEHLEKIMCVFGDDALREKMTLKAIRHIKYNSTWKTYFETLERIIQKVTN
jgi:glycosyltransferase involved in cell wall biosynthesis